MDIIQTSTKAGKSLLKFGSFNVEGLRGKTLDPFLVDFIQDFDFLTLVETWLLPNSKVNFEGFYSFSTFRKKHRQAERFSGGITILIKKNGEKE